MNLFKQNKMELQRENQESETFIYNPEISLDENINKSNEVTLRLRKRKKHNR